MQKRKGTPNVPAGKEHDPADPYAELYKLADKYKPQKAEKEEEGSVAGSLAMLTAIPEVDLGMEYVRGSPAAGASGLTVLLQCSPQKHRGNGEGETPRCGCSEGAENPGQWGRPVDTMCVLAPAYVPLTTNAPIAVFQQNQRPKSDADLIEDARREAMGLPPQEDIRRHNDRNQMATDEYVRSLTCGSLVYVHTVNRLWKSSRRGCVNDHRCFVPHRLPKLYMRRRRQAHLLKGNLYPDGQQGV